MYVQIEQKLSTGGVIILDGGTGTEIQRQGAPMDNEVWCATANLTHPDIVRKVHCDYIAAGSHVITANTFATSPILFHIMGRSAEIEEIDRQAVRIARAARDEMGASDTAIAGSFSVMRPVIKGSNRSERVQIPPKDLQEILTRKAEVLASSGVDLIIMEMMRGLHFSLAAVEAAVATGLPVWVGISVERNEAGKLVGIHSRNWPLGDITSVLMQAGAKACLVMHNDIDITPDAIQIIKQHWSGPIGAYPESGKFTMPDWQFSDISPEEFAIHAQHWHNLGATILGGCCGISPKHIKKLAEIYG